MIVWCGRCNTNPVELTPGGVDAISRFGITIVRPWCRPCVLWAITQPVITTTQRRAMVDADTCGMGVGEEPCVHGVRRSRYCMYCDGDFKPAPTPPPTPTVR